MCSANAAASVNRRRRKIVEGSHALGERPRPANTMRSQQSNNHFVQVYIHANYGGNIGLNL